MPQKVIEPDFKKLVLENQERVRNICFRFLGDMDDADDAAQEVFIQVYESLKGFRNESEVTTWIYRIAVNKSLDMIRRKKRKKRFALLTSVFVDSEEEIEISIPAEGDPGKELEDAERKRILDEALGKIPESQRTALILSKTQGFSNNEIAEIMNITVSAVESLIHRAKTNLRKLLLRYFEE